jgi:hypothetical protein
VDDLGPLQGGRHRQVRRHRLKGPQVRRGAGQRFPRLVGDDGFAGASGAEAVNGKFDHPGQLGGHVLGVDAGAAVDVGRELAGEEGRLQSRAPNRASGPCR